MAFNLPKSPFRITDPKNKSTGGTDSDPVTSWGEKKYAEPTTTTGDWQTTDDGENFKRVITTEKKYVQPGQRTRQTYAKAGVDPSEAKEYWKNNPEKYKEYLKSKNLSRTGADVEQISEFKKITKAKPPTPPLPPPPLPAPPKKINARLVRNSRKNPDGERGVGTQQKDFKNLTPTQQKSIVARNANNNKINESRNLKTRTQLMRDRNWTGKALNSKQEAWINKTLEKTNKIYKDNASRLTIN